MKKDEINSCFRSIASQLSPTSEERELVTKLYKSIYTILGKENCIQIGSYPRFTAITPLHDLDILFIVGEYIQNYDPEETLNTVKSEIESNFENPTEYSINVSAQSHSITLEFNEKGEILFSIDIIPALISGERNEFGKDIYYIPEIGNLSSNKRKRLYENYAKEGKNIQWIKTDPRGYIEEAQNINLGNNDFRKAVKFIKAWKNSCKEKNSNFPIKSFHIEVIITQKFKEIKELEIFDAIFNFFCKLPDFLTNAQFPDRADKSRLIDEYINNLEESEIEEIIEYRDFFLINLENAKTENDIKNLLTAKPYKRKSTTEEYLFDSLIPTFTIDTLQLIIDGFVLPKDGFRGYFLSNKSYDVGFNRKIKFEIRRNNTNADFYKWKVKNDNDSPEPRGEINKNFPRNNPESTKYKGTHYVECFAIKDDICIKKAKINIFI